MITDILGRLAKVGDTILTTGYGTAEMNVVTTIDKFTKAGIKCFVHYSSWHKDVNGKWTKQLSTNGKQMTRASRQFVIINEQLAHNQATWPELYI